MAISIIGIIVLDIAYEQHVWEEKVGSLEKFNMTHDGMSIVIPRISQT